MWSFLRPSALDKNLSIRLFRKVNLFEAVEVHSAPRAHTPLICCRRFARVRFGATISRSRMWPAACGLTRILEMMQPFPREENSLGSRWPPSMAYPLPRALRPVFLCRLGYGSCFSLWYCCRGHLPTFVPVLALLRVLACFQVAHARSRRLLRLKLTRSTMAALR